MYVWKIINNKVTYINQKMSLTTEHGDRDWSIACALFKFF